MVKGGCVEDLRRWRFHNLGFRSGRSIKISNRVSLWFIENCGANPPSNNENWKDCFESLCVEVSSILTHCRDTVGLVLSEPGNGSDVKANSQLRLDRNWPTHKFDQIIGDAATRMGQSLDVVEFRGRNINEWRQYLETVPADDDPEALIIRLIERGLLEHFKSVLPIDSNDVILELELAPGREVAKCLSIAYRLFDSGISGREELLEELKKRYASNKRRPSKLKSF